MIPTLSFRHVWRTLDRNSGELVPVPRGTHTDDHYLALQQWHVKPGSNPADEHLDGEWLDVELASWA